MNYVNNATLIRRELLSKLSRLLLEKNYTDIDRVPLELFPKNSKAVRCCIYKDRAMIRFRLMALLGFGLENEEDELKRLSSYAEESLERKKPEAPFLTVIDEACSSCVKVNYVVTDACQGCVARPCMMNCPKDAIEFVNGRAHIKSEDCINCGICLKECPYHAIIYMPVPCEEACPVDAISKDEHGKEKIDFTKCTYCGKCMRSCPFGAIMERSQIADLIKYLMSDQKTVAMVAPSIVGQFSASLGQLVTALKTLGFDDVIEVAEGAEITTERETKEWVERMEKGESFMTTSCCPAWVETAEKHLPEIKPFLSDTRSPMRYAGEIARKEYPEAVNVFIGPCIAKRKEAWTDDTVDLVLSFEELGSMFIASKIDVQKMESSELKTISAESRGYAISGGVAHAVKTEAKRDDLEVVQIDGLSKQSIKELKRFGKKCPGNFVEVMSCEGGCIAGPNVISNPKLASRQLKKMLGQ